jgi:hypothetical protein
MSFEPSVPDAGAAEEFQYPESSPDLVAEHPPARITRDSIVHPRQTNRPKQGFMVPLHLL